MLDFDGLGRDLLAQADTLVPQWLPNGKRHGREWCVGSLEGESGNSLKINLHTGIWKDFADDGVGGGDLISLYAAVFHLTQKQAAVELGANQMRAGVVATSPDLRREPERILERPPEGATRPKMKHPEFGLPVKFWVYRDATGPLGLVARYEPAGGGKQIVPWTWDSDRGAFRMRGFPKPRPLYGLDHLASRADAPVLIVEGEKACDAARELMPKYVCVTWCGGTNAVGYANWAPLAGRDCTFMPDADVPGVATVPPLYALLAPIVRRLRWIDPDGMPEGHDAADLLAEGWDTKRLLAWARPRLREKPPELEPVPRGTKALPGPAVAPEASPVGDLSGDGPEERGESSTDENSDYSEYDSVNRGTAESEENTVTEDAEKAPKRGRPRDDVAQSKVISVQAQGLEISSIGSLLARWQGLGLTQKRNGDPHHNMDNAVRVLEQDSNWVGQIWLDTFHQKIMRASEKHPLGRIPWEDNDYVMLQLYLQRTVGITDITLANCKLAVRAVACRDQRNELTAWLDTLVWDGVERLAYLCCDGFGTYQNEYTMAVSRCWLVSMIARAYEPGCKVDTVPILEGEQGAYKGTALQILGGYWYTENHANVTDKDFYQILQGRWLTEIAEMHSFRKDVLEKVKGVISCRDDNYRAPYAELPTDHPRQGVMAGSTNRDDWNADDTGARRFWPLQCMAVDTEWIRVNREQLFAEARALYMRVPIGANAIDRLGAGAAWWDVPKALAAAEQDARKATDPWLEIIRTHIYYERIRNHLGDDDVLEPRSSPLDNFNGRYVLQEVIKMEPSKMTRAEEMKVAYILKGLGMAKRSKAGVNVYYWPAGARHILDA